MRLSLLSLPLVAYLAAAADLIGRIEPGETRAYDAVRRVRADCDSWSISIEDGYSCLTGWRDEESFDQA